MSDRGDMNCSQVRARLPLVPGADLLPAEDARVRAHLRGCAACRKELGAFVHVRRVLRELGSAADGGAGAGAVEGVDRAGIPAAEFFARLRAATMTAVRRDAIARRRGARPRRSFASMMAAAALFLLSVYLVLEWSPAPEPFGDVPPIMALSRAGGVGDARFRNVGYGLMGHCLHFAVQPVRLDDEIVDDGPELAPLRDARLIRRVVGAQQTPRRK